jgi:hypothetical protein
MIQMETRTEHAAQAQDDLLDPLAGWEAASRWHRATFDWMAKGWQQWVALMTTVPPRFMAPPTIEPRAPSAAESRRATPAERAAATAEPRRIATRKKAAAKGRKRG